MSLQLVHTAQLFCFRNIEVDISPLEPIKLRLDPPAWPRLGWQNETFLCHVRQKNVGKWLRLFAVPALYRVYYLAVVRELCRVSAE